MRKEREQQRKQSEGRKNENEFSDNQQEHIEHSSSDECINYHTAVLLYVGDDDVELEGLGCRSCNSTP